MSSRWGLDEVGSRIWGLEKKVVGSGGRRGSLRKKGTPAMAAQRPGGLNKERLTHRWARSGAGRRREA
ncbi:hypothetical protein TIFTF001_014133 [Ficus carica]|uniref:Uncharacterized protein n=1 Tax=Ficus carica TaxID=3494 RepID=A0AA88D3Q9_FICCA|nr:hypothetical protein TIFTF001_014133 [Ficus carica]